MHHSGHAPHIDVMPTAVAIVRSTHAAPGLTQHPWVRPQAVAKAEATPRPSVIIIIIIIIIKLPN
jgi:hypothetical protein